MVPLQVLEAVAGVHPRPSLSGAVEDELANVLAVPLPGFTPGLR